MSITLNRADGQRYVRAVSEANALALTVPLISGPFTATATLPPGATVLVEVACSVPSAIDAGQGLFVPVLGLGSVGVLSESSPFSVPGSHTAARFTASAPGVVVEVLQ